MIHLHPPMPSIASSYRTWLKRPTEEAAAAAAPAVPENSSAVKSDAPAAPPHWVADAIRRQVQTRPEKCAPAEGDLIVLHSSDAEGDDALPLLMLLDRGRGSYWSGWLVGAHPDYAGSQDLVLEGELLLEGRDPAPLAAMVQTWNHFHVHLPATVTVLHRLKPAAMEAVRELSLAGIQPGVAPAPGRMQTRQLAGLSVITGTPYGRRDPRDGYLLLCRELTNLISEPSLQRGDRQYGDEEPDY